MTVFGFFLTLHITFGTLCLIVGLIAAFSKKQRGWHTFLGELYHGSYVVVFISAVVTSVMHWQESAYLFFIAFFSYGLALYGYQARKRRSHNWLPKHIGGMLGSYIGIVTAVLIVNVSDIPILNEFPTLIFWFLPTAIGTPIIIAVSRRIKTRSSQPQID
ncbi:DUF2306 domain-containing protein [Filibacter tadaridae]|uniref:DUF2306 domain-containing protein n=1 Tax=Filibacter tadaridae TaxID=2483811 RepID=A0A3P5XPA6_9BACL|nr:DUF2306 domain-containing protein [Filibacter tadaridae]VDC32728.1 hypothetical protein FILTAD_02901 [Filibacter tadaridae]